MAIVSELINVASLVKMVAWQHGKLKGSKQRGVIVGIYDTYRNKDGSVSVQLKVSDSMEYFKEGDITTLSDGIYFGWAGAVVVKDNIVLSVTNKIYNKLGERLEIKTPSKIGGNKELRW